MMDWLIAHNFGIILIMVPPAVLSWGIVSLLEKWEMR